MVLVRVRVLRQLLVSFERPFDVVVARPHRAGKPHRFAHLAYLILSGHFGRLVFDILEKHVGFGDQYLGGRLRGAPVAGSGTQIETWTKCDSRYARLI